MRKTIIALMTFVATAALADGFVCNNAEENLKIKVYNKVNPGEGTRTGSEMILSNPQVHAGRKTIARFSEVNQTLSNNGATYTATVDLRYNDSSRSGELVGDTKLGYIDTLVLDIAYSYSEPVEAGTVVEAELSIIKRNGDQLTYKMACERYLKN